MMHLFDALFGKHRYWNMSQAVGIHPNVGLMMKLLQDINRLVGSMKR